MKIAVYGIGSNFIRNYKWISDRYEICVLVDGSPKKQGTAFQGISVHGPAVLREAEYDKILVTPNAHLEIVNILLGENISPENMIFLNDILPSDDVGRELRIAFQITGGLGDGIIALNYIDAFYKKFGADHIKIYLETISGRNGFKELIPKNHYFAGIQEGSDNGIRHGEYHLYMRVQRYPEVMYADTVRIARLMPGLIDYIQLCEKFRIFNARFFDRDFVGDGESAAFEELLGRKRIMQPDIYGFLNLSENYGYRLCADEKALGKFGLKAGGYISIHRGTEEKNYSGTSTKLWPTDHYNGLFGLLGEKHPEIPLVLVGAEYEKNAKVHFQGLDLVGKTTLPELAMIVGGARVHIDTEGGVVHLRHAVSGKPSVVIFGPTSDRFFGYSENENIRSGACPYPCEWVSMDWHRQCIRGDEVPSCMLKTTPRTVLNAVERILVRADE